MSVQIKSMVQVATPALSVPAVNPLSFYGVILGGGGFYTLYEAKDNAALVKSIRLVNFGASTASITLYYARVQGDGTVRRIISRMVNFGLPPEDPYIDEINLSLDAGDKIQGRVSNGVHTVSFLISGVEA